MKKFKVDLGGSFDATPEIVETNIEKDDDNFIWENGVKLHKNSAWHGYFDTYEEAKAALVNKEKHLIEFYSEKLKNSKKVLEEVEALEKIA